MKSRHPRVMSDLGRAIARGYNPYRKELELGRDDVRGSGSSIWTHCGVAVEVATWGPCPFRYLTSSAWIVEYPK